MSLRILRRQERSRTHQYRLILSVHLMPLPEIQQKVILAHPHGKGPQSRQRLCHVEVPVSCGLRYLRATAGFGGLCFNVCIHLSTNLSQYCNGFGTYRTIHIHVYMVQSVPPCQALSPLTLQDAPGEKLLSEASRCIRVSGRRISSLCVSPKFCRPGFAADKEWAKLCPQATHSAGPQNQQNALHRK